MTASSMRPGGRSVENVGSTSFLVRGAISENVENALKRLGNGTLFMSSLMNLNLSKLIRVRLPVERSCHGVYDEPGECPHCTKPIKGNLDQTYTEMQTYTCESCKHTFVFVAVCDDLDSPRFVRHGILTRPQ